jgi:PAS domain S-box-containing protein
MHEGGVSHSKVVADARYRATIASLAEGVISADAQGRIEFMNPAAERLTGWTENEAQGKPLEEIVRLHKDETHAPMENPGERALRLGQSVELTNHTLLIIRDGKQVAVEGRTTPIVGAEGVTAGAVLVFRELSAELEEARLSRQRFDLHVKHTPLGVVEFTRDGRIARWNSAAAEIFGFSEEEVVGQDWRIIVPEAVWGQLDGVWEGLASQSGGGRSTNLNRHKSGRTIHCEWFNTPLIAADGTSMGVASLVMDVTERNLALEELARHRADLQELVHERTAELEVSKAHLIEAQRVAQLGSWEWDVVPDIVTGSEEFYRLFDVHPDQLARYQQFAECLHPDDRERVATEVNEALHKSRTYDTDYRVRLADGRWRDIHARGELFTDTEGKPLRLAGTCLDITERKRAEQALRESEESYRTTLQSIGDAVISTDASGHIAQMNPVAETLTGWLEAEARGQPLESVFRIVNEDTRALVESPVSRVLREGQVVGLANHTILIAKDGKEWPIADSGAPIRNANGETTGVVLVFRDQTEERAARQALSEREAQFRATFEQAAVGIAHIGLGGAWLRVNQRLCDIVGYTSEELLQKTFQDITHPDDLDSDLSYVRQVVTGEIQTYSMEKRYIRKDRSLVWINLTVSPVRDDSGALKYFVSVVEDISARKRAQEALDVSQQRLSSMINAITESAFLMDPDGTILLANGSVAERLGTTTAAMVGRSVFDLLPFELAQARRQRIAEVIQSRGAVQFEDCRGGRHILNSMYPVFDSENMVRQLAVFGHDITERKRAEEALRDSEERYRTTLQSIGDAVISTDSTGHIAQMNPVAETLTGWLEAEARGQPLESVFRIINEETRALVESPVTRVLREGQIVGLANHTILIAKDGKEWPIADSGAPIRNPNGETTGVVLVFRDQTEERRAEREIREAEERFRTFFDNAPIGKCMTAPDGQVLRANPAFGEMLGYSVEEIQNVSFATLTHPDDLPETLECVRKLLAAERESWSIEKRYIAKDGRIVWTSVATALQRDPQGNPLYLLTHIQDITDRKRAEQEIESLSRFPLENPNPILRVRQDGMVLYANPSSEGLLVEWGCAAGEFLPSKVQLVITKSISENANTTVEVSCGNRVLSVLFVPIPGTDYVNLYGRDITEREQAIEKLQISEAKYRGLHESMRDAFVEVNQDGSITDFNREYVNMLGYTPDELRQLRYQSLTPEKWHAMESDIIDQQILKRGYSDVYEKEYRRKDGTVFPVELRAFLLRDASGQPGNIWGIARDITARKSIESRLQKVVEDLARSNQELEQFAYIASHDLQEPLRMVASYTQLLAERYENQLDDKAKLYIGYAVDGALRMQQLINDLLTYSRLNTRAKAPELVDVNNVVFDVFRNLQVAIDESRASVTTDELPTLRADASQLVQVFQNLIANALKFRRDEPPHIRVSARDDGQYWCFSVQDNGIGIEAKYAERVFVIFQRLHTRQEYPGTGIGLAVCKRVVDRHGGKLWFESEPGKGTTFFFTLPK